MRFKTISYFVLLAATVCINSCRSQHSLIKNVHSYSFIRQEGIIKASSGDNEGFTKPDTIFIVYAEVTTDKLEWETAFMNGKEYKIVPQLISAGNVEAGFDDKGLPVTIHVKNNHFLFQLQFEHLNDHVQPPGINTTEPMIRFRFKNKTYVNKLKSPLLLTQLPPV